MSLKLGNTNIAGTQILYSTTGNNTDGAMTQAVTTTQLNLKANDADVVHKTREEIINGEKLFANTLREKTTGTSYGSYVDFIQEINNARRGTIRTTYNSDGSYSITLGSNGPDASAPEGIKVIRNSSSIWTAAPASDVNGSIVTTVNKSKSENGYFKLGNGLIIQWGLVTNMSNNKAWVNFPTPFTAVPQVVTTSDKDGVNDGYNSYVSGTSRTGFNAFNKEYGTSQNCLVHWIAVGY